MRGRLGLSRTARLISMFEGVADFINDESRCFSENTWESLWVHGSLMGSGISRLREIP